MSSALFIHRSVGHNLLRDGDVYKLASAVSPNFDLSDYDHNLDILTDRAGSVKKMSFRFPGGNTNPADYAALFSNQVASTYQPILDFILSYDTVILKSCYPNSNITSDKELKAIKGYYLSIGQFFASYPKKRLILLTSPPLRKLRTSKVAANRARQLADWLTSTNLGANTSVFDFYSLLAGSHGTLRKEYCRRLPFDSHPNAKASQTIAPLFVGFLAKNLA